MRGWVRGSTLLSTLIILLCPAAARGDVADYLGKRIVSIRFESENRAASGAGLLRMVETKVGQPLAMIDVRKTVVHLFSLGRFEDVRVHATARGEGVDLLYELAPAHPVERLVFAGDVTAPGVDAGRLRRAVVERFGAAPSAVRAPDVARLVESQLADRGYLHAHVTPRVQIEHAPARAILLLSIASGPRTVVGEVDVTGQPGMPVPQLVERLRVARGAPYEREALAARVAEYLADQRARGYYEARLTTSPRLVEDDRAVNLTVTAAPGARVRIVFTGDELPGNVRDELVPIAREGSADEDLLEDSTIRIEDYLRAQGYRDAAAPHTREEINGELVVTFAVKKGRQYRVAEIAMAGNTFLPRASLEQMLRLRAGQPFQTARLDADIAAITDLYRRRGFAAVKVDSSVEPAAAAEGSADVPVVVRLAITENGQAIVGSIHVAGNATVQERDLLEGVALRPGSEFFVTQMAMDRDAVQLKYANLGYLSATVDSNPGLSADGTRADIVYRVSEGPRILVDHILIVGNVRTRTETIERELQIRPGDPLGLAAVTESQRRLTALGLFRRTRIAQLTHGDETTRDLLITVDEAPPTTVGYGGGLELGSRIRSEADQGGIASERQELAPRAFFEITRRNLFGKNRSVNLFTRISVRPQNSTAGGGSGYGFSEYRVLGTFREPRVFGSAADAFLTGTTEQQIRSSFNFARRAFTAEAGRRLTRALSASGSYQIQRTELFDEKINEADKPLIDRLFPQVLLSSFSVSGIHDTRDDQLDPGAGQYFSANGQLAARRLGSEVGFVKSYLTAQMFRTLPDSGRVVVAASARLGTAAGFARHIVQTGADGLPIIATTSDLPASERFFAGGDTTVRGFALDQLGAASTIDQKGFPIGGNALVIFNAELRAPIRTGFGVVGFVDSGNVFARTTDIDFGQLRSAVGFGFRYRSPVGPIRIDIGFKVKRHEIATGRLEARHAWHITLGQAF
jgi:outer membrane protein insertion porin family